MYGVAMLRLAGVVSLAAAVYGKLSLSLSLSLSLPPSYSPPLPPVEGHEPPPHLNRGCATHHTIALTDGGDAILGPRAQALHVCRLFGEMGGRGWLG